MMRFSLAAVAAVAAVAANLPQAHAFPPPGVPTTINPGLLTPSGGSSDAIFAFSDAGDISDLVLTGFGGNPIFNNGANGPGDTVALGVLAGPQQFGLNNLTTGKSFLADQPDVDGNYHVFYSTNFADFSVNGGVLPAAAAAAIAALPSGTSVIYVGWEDLVNGEGVDWDYNDLIFAFTNLRAPSVPEPASLTLLGLGLAGLGLARRRK